MKHGQFEKLGVPSVAVKHGEASGGFGVENWGAGAKDYGGGGGCLSAAGERERGQRKGEKGRCSSGFIG